MSKLFEYIISIKDKASAAAIKIDKAVGGLNEDMKKVTTAATAMQDKVTSSFSKMATKVRQSMSQMSRDIGDKVSGWRKDFADNLPGARLLKNPLALSGAAIGGFWAATLKAMEAGKEKMKLQVLTGSQEIGSALYDGLTKFATDTVFGSELYDYATQMLANGIKDADVMPLMKVLGDISMGDANKLGQLSLAFAQINAKGHLAGQELLQLINAGFNPLQVLSQKTGVSMESLTDKMSKGQISVADVRKAMEMATGPGGKFNNMLDKVANTPFGQLEGLKGQLEQMFIQIGNIFLPIATKLMAFLSWINEKAGPYMKPLVIILAGLSAGLLVAAAAQWAFNSALFANPVTWIVAGVVALIGVIVYLISAFDGWANAWNNLLKGLKYEWLAFKGSFVVAWDTAVVEFMKGIDLIQRGWYKVKSLWDEDGANAGLAKLNAEAENRSRKLAYEKGLQQTYNKMAVDAYGNVFGEKGLHRNNATLSDTVNKIKSAVLPGAGGGKQTDGDTGTKKSREAVATGGTKNTTINIQIGKQEANVSVVTNTLKEGLSKMREMIIEEMTRAAAMAGALAS